MESNKKYEYPELHEYPNCYEQRDDHENDDTCACLPDVKEQIKVVEKQYKDRTETTEIILLRVITHKPIKEMNH